MSSDDENKEITVKAPSKSGISPEKQAEKATQKALEEERFNVLEFPKKISRFLGVIVTGTGFFLFSLFVFMSVSGQTDGILLSLRNSWLTLVVWGFVGLLNIIFGFLLMGRE